MLRPATLDDLSILRGIKHAAQDWLSRNGSLQVLGDVETVEEYLLFWPSDIVADAPIGSCRLSPRVPLHIQPCLPTHPDMYLSSLVIHPAFQSRGLGRQLMVELQSLRKSMALDLWAGNDRLRRWYQELGWRFVATVEETGGDQTYDVAIYVWP
ncbi:hypothetical protein OPQ81_005112 [Rhizoctonia solani]|nr:hypothetical protein OPQ81_005112 [Rhizoctonia solani]